MNMKTLHWIALALGAVVEVAQYLAASEPSVATVCHVVSAVAGALLPVLAAMSDKAIGAKPEPAPVDKSGQQGFAYLRYLFVVACLGTACALAPIFCGCAWWKGGGGVATVSAVECIAEHALDGESVEDIARHCMVDVGRVVTTLADSSDPKVSRTPAAAEARAARRAMFAVDGGL